MRQLSQAELMTATALDRNLLKQHQHRGQVALAFGRDRCYESLSYVELDAAAIMLADTITKTHSRDIAAQIVRVHCDKWAEAVALCEIDYQTPGYFVVADFVNSKGQATHLTGATNDQEAAFALITKQPQAAGHKLTRINFIDMAPLMRFVQSTASKPPLKLNLLDRWVPKHGSPEFIKLFSPYADARDAAIKKVSTERVEQAMLLKAGGKARANVEKVIAGGS
jgi:hypothetical protein